MKAVRHYFVRHKHPNGETRISIFRAYTPEHASLRMKAGHPDSKVTELRPATAVEIAAWQDATAKGQVKTDKRPTTAH